MKRELYGAAVRLSPLGIRQKINAATGELKDTGRQKEIIGIFRRYRVLGASLVLFDASGITGSLHTGTGGEMGPVVPGTFFRTASISKMVSAALFVRAAAEGRCDLDAPLSRVFGSGFAAPAYPGAELTPRMLLSHTGTVSDGDVLEKGAREGWPAEKVLRHMRFTGGVPGESFCYSNLGAALCGEALTRWTGEDLDSLLRASFPVEGTYDAARLPGEVPLSDGRLVLTGRTAFSALARQSGAVTVPAWCRAHGNLCLSAEDLALIAGRLMTSDTYRIMARPVIPFGSRDPAILSGLGMFIIPMKRSGTVCGHQGLAYGACHGVFFDGGKGFVFLTSGCSLERRWVLSGLNLALIRLFLTQEDPYA